MVKIIIIKIKYLHTLYGAVYCLSLKRSAYLLQQCSSDVFCDWTGSGSLELGAQRMWSSENYMVWYII